MAKREGNTGNDKSRFLPAIGMEQLRPGPKYDKGHDDGQYPSDNQGKCTRQQNLLVQVLETSGACSGCHAEDGKAKYTSVAAQPGWLAKCIET